MKSLKLLLIALPIFWVIGFFMGMYEDSEFKERKQEHISSIRLKLDHHDYSGAEALAKSFLRHDDSDIDALYEEAKQKKAEQSRINEIDRNLKIVSSSKSDDYKAILQAYKKLSYLTPENSTYSSELEKYSTLREEQLLAELKTIPGSKYKENLNRYNELKSIRPESEKYDLKSANYAEKIKAQEKKNKAFAEAVNTGKFRAERLVRSSLKNPDSYEHVSTKYLTTDKELVYIVTYRATNSFNAVVIGKSVVKTNMEGLGARITASN